MGQEFRVPWVCRFSLFANTFSSQPNQLLQILEPWPEWVSHIILALQDEEEEEEPKENEEFKEEVL